MNIKEKLWGQISFNPRSLKFTAGKKLSLEKSDIKGAFFSYETSLKLGNKEIGKEKHGAVLTLLTKEPLPQAGKLLFGKSQSLLFYFDEENVNLVKELELAMAEAEMLTPQSGEENFVLGRTKCIIEAKKACNDYTRAGTTGANPYGKAGIVSAVILPSLNLDEGTVSFKYLGTTSRFHESEYFYHHPEIVFSLKSCHAKSKLIEVSGGRFVGKLEFFRWDIEKDEKASGLWYVSFEKIFQSAVDAAMWLSFLSCEDEKNFLPHPDKANLISMVEALRKANVLTEDEVRVKKEIIEKL